MSTSTIGSQLAPGLEIRVIKSARYVPQLARVKFEAFKHNELNAQMYPVITNEEGTMAWLEERDHRNLTSSKHTTIAIVDTNRDEILARATWTIPTRLIASSADPQESDQAPNQADPGLPEYPEGSNVPLLDLFREIRQHQQKKHYNAETDYYLGALYTDPRHQGRGLATELLSWGARQADANSARIYLEGAPLARKLYLKLGWTDIEQYPIDLAEFGGEASYMVYMMERLPVSTAS